jgi:Tol biopolymer transport system component
VFSADWRDRRALWRVPADGRSGAVAFTAGGNDSHEVAISPQGQLIYSTDSYLFQLWRLPIGHDSAGPAVRFLRSTRLDQFAQYSPDGKRIAFNSTRSGNNEIWVCNDDGSALMQLTSSATWSGTPRWSPDGLRIAFDSNSTGSWQIFVVNSRGGKPVQLTTNPHDNYIPSWSRDGNWIYFSSERTGRNEIWKIPSAGGRDIQLTRNGGYSGFETPSGTELYFTKNDGRGKLWRMCLPDRAEEVVAESVRGRTFEPGTRGVYFIEDSSAGATLRFLPYGSGPAITLASLGKALVVSLTVSPDEREAVYSRRVDTDTELMLVEGFGRKHGP